jgi:hypothetical protein
MTKIKQKLPKELLCELEGADWSLESGKGHHKLIVNGRLAGLIPSHMRTSDKRPMLNTRTQIRRILSLANVTHCDTVSQ